MSDGVEGGEEIVPFVKPRSHLLSRAVIAVLLLATELPSIMEKSKLQAIAPNESATEPHRVS